MDTAQTESRQRTAWHTLEAEQALTDLASDATTGLTSQRAAELLEERGLNELTAQERDPAWRMFVAQFNDFMIWVLMAAAVFSAVEGQMPEAIAIGAILLLNGVLGFVQEYRAEQALEALKQMSAPTATVIRGRRSCARQVTECPQMPAFSRSAPFAWRRRH